MIRTLTIRALAAAVLLAFWAMPAHASWQGRACGSGGPVYNAVESLELMLDGVNFAPKPASLGPHTERRIAVAPGVISLCGLRYVQRDMTILDVNLERTGYENEDPAVFPLVTVWDGTLVKRLSLAAPGLRDRRVFIMEGSNDFLIEYVLPLGNDLVRVSLQTMLYGAVPKGNVTWAYVQVLRPMTSQRVDFSVAERPLSELEKGSEFDADAVIASFDGGGDAGGSQDGGENRSDPPLDPGSETNNAGGTNGGTDGPDESSPTLAELFGFEERRSCAERGYPAEFGEDRCDRIAALHDEMLLCLSLGTSCPDFMSAEAFETFLRGTDGAGRDAFLRQIAISRVPR